MNTPNFSDIYTLYFEDVYKYLLALCHDEELAEELAQDHRNCNNDYRPYSDIWNILCLVYKTK